MKCVVRCADIGFWIVAGAAWMAMGQDSGFVPCYAVGVAVWSYVGWLVIREGAEKQRRLARRDLREIYPPKRDQFQRDLERLNKLRGTPAAVPPPDSATAQRRKLERKRTTHLGYVDVLLLLIGRREQKKWHRRRTIAGPTYGAVLEGFRDGCERMLWIVAMVLTVTVVVGAAFLGFMGIGSLL